MNVLEQWAQLTPQGYQFLKDLHRAAQRTSVEQLAIQLDRKVADIKRMLRVYKILGGRLTNVEGLGVQRLELIANAFNALETKSRDNMSALIEVARHSTSVDETQTALRQQVSTMNQKQVRKPDVLFFQRSAGSDGKRQILGRMDQHKVAAMEAVLYTMAKKIRRANPAMPLAVAYAEALYTKVVSREGSAPQLFEPAFLIPLRGQYRYFADGKIATAEGGLVDLTEVVNQELAPTGYACVIAKDSKDVPQVVDVVRVATDSQRRGAVLETLLCAHPDCSTPAINCQAHHIEAWARGGPTESPNLVSLCAVHNGRNDDDPDQPKNGRIERDPTTGTPGWVARSGDSVRTSTHPLVAKGWRAWAATVYDESF